VKSVVILASGGMDSTVLLAKAVKDGHEVIPIHFDYGQLAYDKEREHLVQLLEYYGDGIERLVEIELDRDTFRNLQMTSSGSDLRGDPSQLALSPAEVPLRNGIFIMFGVSVAMRLRAQEVWIGTHMSRSKSGLDSLYPDSSTDFIACMASATAIGTRQKVRLVAPLQTSYKEGVLRTGERLGVPWHLTYSCYVGGNPCGECLACVDRRQALAQVEEWRTLR
jgi:7-cyano-7-deazaguanine synthase